MKLTLKNGWWTIENYNQSTEKWEVVYITRDKNLAEQRYNELKNK